MKLTLWQRFICWFLIKPILRSRETTKTLKGMAEKFGKDELTHNEQIVAYCAQQIVESINKTEEV